MENKKIRNVRADEIDCRVGTITATGFSLLLYKDARVDMNILDETFGMFNWQREHKMIGDTLYCGVSIYDDEKKEWITKWDAGVESQTEAEKGRASDSFKRACVNLGIGRELYTAPFIWVKGNVQQNSKGKNVPTFKNIVVSKLEVKDGNITAVEICGDGEVIYSYGFKKAPKIEEKQEKPIQDWQVLKMQELGVNMANVLKRYKIEDIKELTSADADFIIKAKQEALNGGKN